MDFCNSLGNGNPEMLTIGKEFAMNEIILLTILAVILITSAFLILVLIELRRTSKRLNDFLEVTEKDFAPAVAEFKPTIENLKFITGDVRSVTDRVRGMSESLSSTSENIRSISRTISGMENEASATIAGLKAGLKTSLMVFIKNISRKGG